MNPTTVLSRVSTIQRLTRGLTRYDDTLCVLVYIAIDIVAKTANIYKYLYEKLLSLNPSQGQLKDTYKTVKKLFGVPYSSQVDSVLKNPCP